LCGEGRTGERGRGGFYAFQNIWELVYQGVEEGNCFLEIQRKVTFDGERGKELVLVVVVPRETAHPLDPHQNDAVKNYLPSFLSPGPLSLV